MKNFEHKEKEGATKTRKYLFISNTNMKITKNYIKISTSRNHTEKYLLTTGANQTAQKKTMLQEILFLATKRKN